MIHGSGMPSGEPPGVDTIGFLPIRVRATLEQQAHDIVIGVTGTHDECGQTNAALPVHLRAALPQSAYAPRIALRHRHDYRVRRMVPTARRQSGDGQKETAHTVMSSGNENIRSTLQCEELFVSEMCQQPATPVT
jgi:hypothetical protein